MYAETLAAIGNPSVNSQGNNDTTAFVDLGK